MQGPVKQTLRLMSLLGVGDTIQPLDYSDKDGLLLQSKFGQNADSLNKRHGDESSGA